MAIRRHHLQFFKDMYTYRTRLAWNGYARREPSARLHLKSGRHDPYPLYEQIRRRGRVVGSPMGSLVTVDHEVCSKILRSPDFGVHGEKSDDHNAILRTGELAILEGRSYPLSLVESNPPDHTRLRQVIAREFTAKHIERFTPRAEAVMQQLVKNVSTDEPFDLMSRLAAPLPIAVITELLGIPNVNTEEFATHVQRLGGALGGVQSLAHARELAATRNRLVAMFTDLFDLKRREPRDDLISRIVASDSPVGPDELIPLCTILLIAGSETAINTIGNTVLALVNHPDQWRMLTEQPELVERAVEEGLRYDSAAQGTGRIALRDSEIAGHAFRAGDWVQTWIGGANRDPAIFTDPSRFDLTRQNASDHLSFSGGAHYCVGAALARLQVTIALRAIVTEFPGLKLAGARSLRRGSLIRGIQHFPVQAAGARQAVIA